MTQTPFWLKRHPVSMTASMAVVLHHHRLAWLWPDAGVLKRVSYQRRTWSEGTALLLPAWALVIRPPPLYPLCVQYLHVPTPLILSKDSPLLCPSMTTPQENMKKRYHPLDLFLISTLVFNLQSPQKCLCIQRVYWHPRVYLLIMITKMLFVYINT